MAVDYVCGMHVDEKKAVDSFEYKGRTYYFCAPGCKTAFEKDPERYIQSRQDPWQHAGKHHCH